MSEKYSDDEWMIDPNEDQNPPEPERWHCEDGRKVFAARGMRRFKTPGGTDGLEISFVCVDDLETQNPEDNDVGLTAQLTVWVTPRGTWPLGRLAKAMGYLEKFDPRDDEAVEAAIGGGYFIGTVEVEEYERNNGKIGTKAKIEEGNPEPYEGDVDPAWADIVNASAAEYAEWLEERNKRSQNRSQGRGGSGNRRRRSRGNGGRRGRGGSGGGSYDPDPEYGF